MKRIKIKSCLKDFKGTADISANRSRMIDAAPDTPLKSVYAANELAETLHPRNFSLTVTDCYKEEDMVFVTLEPDEKDTVFYFREGQLLTVKFSESKNTYSVPVMSISGKKSIVVCVTPLFSAYQHFINSKGKRLTGISFEGNFFYSRLRDGNRICVLTDYNALPVIHSIASKNCDTEMTVYIFGKDVRSFRNLNLTPVSQLPDFENTCSIYICGSDEFCKKIQAEVSLSGCTPVSLRILSLGAKEENPLSQTVHKCKVICKGKEYEIRCIEGEKLLRALENADVPVNGRCGNGECGYCRSRLLEGKVRQLTHMNDRRTAADVIYGYIHPCCVTPESDITIEI